MDLVFGPVPSRRLGRSLGINSIPPKACSYGCIYCQVGPTRHPEIDPRPFFDPQELTDAVVERVRAARAAGETIDYLTFVPDGEPTLDSRLGETIELLRPTGIPIAIISNGSLLWRPDVREAVARADWVSVKVDAVDEATWRRVNAPHRSLDLAAVLSGIEGFAAEFAGTLVSETMLLDGINDGPASLEAVAGFLSGLYVAVASVAVPIRPPNVSRARVPSEAALIRAHQILSERLGQVELLIGYEGDAFASTGDLRTDLLSITAVHPLRSSAVEALRIRCGADAEDVAALVAAGLLAEVSHRGERFLVRPARRESAS